MLLFYKALLSLFGERSKGAFIELRGKSLVRVTEGLGDGLREK
jgi:hypothetical protein